MIQADTIYEEKVFSPLTAGLLGVFSAASLFVLIYQALVGPLGDRPAPQWVLLVMFLLFLWLTMTFSRLSISMDPRGITVSFGAIRKHIVWSSVQDCYLDDWPMMRYGG